MGTKKKSKTSKKTEGSKDDAAAPVAAGEFGTTLKKRKKTKPKAETDEFEAKLAEAGGDVGEVEAEAENEEDGDMDAGTGVWSHDNEKPIKYDLLLDRFFAHLHRAHPDLFSSGSRAFLLQPPQCLREGNKKTIFANLPDICKRMKRSDEHVISFMFAELGTSGSVDGSKRLVIKGRFQVSGVFLFVQTIAMSGR